MSCSAYRIPVGLLAAAQAAIKEAKAVEKAAKTAAGFGRILDRTTSRGLRCDMPPAVSVPKSWVASVGRLSLPKSTQRRMQALMDHNNEGLLAPAERRELAALVEWSEKVSLIRAGALELLRDQPA